MVAVAAAGRAWVSLLALRRRLEAGEAIALVAVALPLFLAVVGLALDGGLVLAARRELLDVADSAARAGVAQVDVRRYRDTAGADLSLDLVRAREAAQEVVAQSGADPVAVEAQPRAVRVEVEREVPLGFLRVVGLRTARVRAAAVAEVRYGVEQGTR